MTKGVGATWGGGGGGGGGEGGGGGVVEHHGRLHPSPSLSSHGE